MTAILCIVSFVLGVALANFMYKLTTKNLLNTAFLPPNKWVSSFTCKEVPMTVMFGTIPELLTVSNRYIELLSSMQPYMRPNTDKLIPDVYERAYNTTVISIYAQIFLIKTFTDVQTIPISRKQEYQYMWNSYIAEQQRRNTHCDEDPIV